MRRRGRKTEGYSEGCGAPRSLIVAAVVVAASRLRTARRRHEDWGRRIQAAATSMTRAVPVVWSVCVQRAPRMGWSMRGSRRAHRGL